MVSSRLCKNEGIGEELKADLVILDNFSTLANVMDENSASAMDPATNLMRNIQRLGSAVIMVHHARKNSGGDGSYRGSQKLSVCFNNIIRLEQTPEQTLEGSASFRMIWEKNRSKRNDEVQERSVSLEDGLWNYELTDKPELVEMVRLIRSREFQSQKDIADHLGVDKATVSRRIKKAFGADLISKDEMNKCFEEARDLEDPEDTQDF